MPKKEWNWRAELGIDYEGAETKVSKKKEKIKPKKSSKKASKKSKNKSEEWNWRADLGIDYPEASSKKSRSKDVWAHCSNKKCKDYTQMLQVKEKILGLRVCGECTKLLRKAKIYNGKPVMPNDGNYDPSSYESLSTNSTTSDYDKPIYVFGQLYYENGYKQWLTSAKQYLKDISKNTEFENYSYNLTHKTQGNYWNCERVYPKSRNEFITKFFRNKKPKGLEGLWKMDNWGLIGVVRESNYYQVYNIKIDVPRPEAQKSGVESFFDSLLGEESPKDINYSLVNGTKDCAWIPTSEKNIFSWEGRNVYLLPTEDNLHIFANEEAKMDLQVINNNLVKFIEQYGDREPTAQRVWPTVTEEDEITSKGSSKGPTSGTGFFVDNNGHIVTNYHVVSPCDGKQKIVFNNKEYSANLIAKDEQLDLALLKVNIKNKSFIKISNKPIKKLQSIIAAGYPGGKALSDDLKFTSGIVSSLKGFKDNSSQIQIDAALNMGNSGGPIVDSKNGELVAVAVSMLRNEIVEGINFGIKVSQVRDFLYSNHIDTDKIAKQFKKRDLNNILENSTLYIFCN